MSSVLKLAAAAASESQEGQEGGKKRLGKLVERSENTGAGCFQVIIMVFLVSEMHPDKGSECHETESKGSERFRSSVSH